MRSAVVVLIVAAVSITGLTGVLLMKTLNAPPPETAAGAATVPAVSQTESVLVAGDSMDGGTTIGPASLIWQDWPKAAAESAKASGFAVAADEASKAPLLQNYDGTVLTSPMVRGEPIRDEKVAHLEGDRKSSLIAVIVSPGMRAYTIPVDNLNSFGGMIQPGDRIDVILTVELTDNGSGQVNAAGRQAPRIVGETVLRNARVLAVERKIAVVPPPSGPDTTPIPNNVSLEVTPQQAERLAVGLRYGKYSAALHPLRNGGDIARIGFPVTTDLDVMPGLRAERADVPTVAMDPGPNPFPLPPPPAPPPALAPTVSVYRWTQQTAVPLTSGGGGIRQGSPSVSSPDVDGKTSAIPPPPTPPAAASPTPAPTVKTPPRSNG